MADNVPITAGAGTNIATDDIGGVQYQRVKLSLGADGSATDAKTIDADTGAGNDPTLGVALVLPASGGGVTAPGDSTNGLDVDVTRVIPGTTATALGKAEDAPHADGDVGVLMLGVRNHSGAGADGDYTALSTTPEGFLNTEMRRDTVRISVASAGLTIATTAYTAGDQVGTQFTLAGAARVAGGTGRIRSVILVDAADIIGPYDVVFTRSSITLAGDNAAYAISDTDALAIVGYVQLTGAFDLTNNRIAFAHGLDIPYDCTGTDLFAGLITRAGHTFFAAVGNLQLIVLVERD